MAGELGDLRFEFRQGKRIDLVMDAVHEGSQVLVGCTVMVAEKDRKVMSSVYAYLLILLKFITYSEQPNVGVVVIAGAQAMPHAAGDPMRCYGIAQAHRDQGLHA